MAIVKTEAQFADALDNPMIGAAQAHIADAATNTATDLATDYTDDAGAKDLDTDAKRVAAMNATNTRVNAVATALNAQAAKVNAILAVLEAHGLVKSS